MSESPEKKKDEEFPQNQEEQHEKKEETEKVSENRYELNKSDILQAKNAVSEAFQERKDMLFKSVVDFQKRKESELQKNENLIEIIQGKVDSFTVMINNLYEFYIDFFKFKQKEERSYSKGKKLVPGDFPKSLEKYFCPEMKESIIEADELHCHRKTKALEFSTLIEKEIIGSTLMKSIQLFNERISHVRDNLISLKKKMVQSNINSSKSFKKFEEVFAIQRGIIHKSAIKNKDLLSKYIKYLRLCSVEIGNLSVLAKESKVFYELAKNSEKGLYEALGKAISLFSTHIESNFFCSEPEKKIIREMNGLVSKLESSPSKLSLENLVNDHFIKSLSIEFASETEFFAFVEDFKIEIEFDDKAIIKSFLSSTKNKNVQILQSLDNYLIFIELPKDSHDFFNFKPFLKCNICNLNFAVNEENKEVEITSQTKTLYFFKKEKKYYLTFSSQDKLEEFTLQISRFKAICT